MLNWWCKSLGGECEQVVGRSKWFLLDETNVDVPSKQSPRSSERTPPGGSPRCSAVESRSSALSVLYYGQWCRSVPALYRVRVDHAAKIAGKVDRRRRGSGSGSLLFERRQRDARNRVICGTGWETSERQTTGGYDAKRVFCRLGRPFGSGPTLSSCSRRRARDWNDEPQRKGGDGAVWAQSQPAEWRADHLLVWGDVVKVNQSINLQCLMVVDVSSYVSIQASMYRKTRELQGKS